MTADDFLLSFAALAVADWYFGNIQSTVSDICRRNQQPLIPVGQMFLPDEIRFAFPTTLLKWALAGWFAIYVDWKVAVAALLISSFTNSLGPTVYSLARPRIYSKIDRLRGEDPEFYGQLSRMAASLLDRHD